MKSTPHSETCKQPKKGRSAAGRRWVLTVAMLFLSAALLPGLARGANTTSSDWLFDKSYYTDRPHSGHRVWQYAPPKTPYHDPDAVFDSPMGSYPFAPVSYDPYPYYYNPYYYWMTRPVSPFAHGWNYRWDANGYYPYDGDPND